ncbi:hypothetical protein Bca52824_066166 [Brassica carinata]|uniref:Uncharacterized protein n=1 Tax=Brassica carinata TaxID=52824 RepID=A0A8X7UD43_BRACI|nr:hypothetical protein Bca52824_066166 [Brassica carinata]
MTDCQILDHTVVFSLILSLCLVDNQLGVAIDLDVLCAQLVSGDNLAIMASYFLSLFVALKLHLTALDDVFPVWDVSTIPTPAPRTLLEPSTCRTHSPSPFVPL